MEAPVGEDRRVRHVGLLDAPVLARAGPEDEADRLLWCFRRSSRAATGLSPYSVSGYDERSSTVGTSSLNGTRSHVAASSSSRPGRGVVADVRRLVLRRRRRRRRRRELVVERLADDDDQHRAAGRARAASGPSAAASTSDGTNSFASALAAALAPFCVRVVVDLRVEVVLRRRVRLAAFVRRQHRHVAALREQVGAFAAEPATPLPFSTVTRRLLRRRRLRLRLRLRRARRRSRPSTADVGVREPSTAVWIVRRSARQLAVARDARRSGPGRSARPAASPRRARSASTVRSLELAADLDVVRDRRDDRRQLERREVAARTAA